MAGLSLLLDTHALIWLLEGGDLGLAARDAIAVAAEENAVLVSAVTAWEIGILCSPRTTRPARLALTPDARTWYETAMSLPGVREVPLTSSAALAAATLPGNLHHDPADRLLAATAREIGAALVTRDRRLLDYAKAGHLNVLAC